MSSDVKSAIMAVQEVSSFSSLWLYYEAMVEYAYVVWYFLGYGKNDERVAFQFKG